MATTKTKAGRKSARKSGNDSKQQSALEHGGSLAQRTGAEEVNTTAPDTPTEITSAAPPNDPALRETGRASSPMFDEVPVTGKGTTGTLPAPVSQEIKPGAPADPANPAELPVGFKLEVLSSGVMISVPVAGVRQHFHGATIPAAFLAFRNFGVTGPAKLDHGEKVKTPDQLAQADAAALERSKLDLAARGIAAD